MGCKGGVVNLLEKCEGAFVGGIEIDIGSSMGVFCVFWDDGWMGIGLSNMSKPP